MAPTSMQNEEQSPNSWKSRLRSRRTAEPSVNKRKYSADGLLLPVKRRATQLLPEEAAILPLTRSNLKLLNEAVEPPTKPASRPGPASKRSYETSVTSASSRAFSANEIGFENALRDQNVDFLVGWEQPREEDVVALLRVMDRSRDSPEPDAEFFYASRQKAERENEATVVNKVTALIFPCHDLPFNNQKTSNLLYRQDTSWHNWGSLSPGILPTPKPDYCISLHTSVLTPAQRELLSSPYADKAGFLPCLILEAKTAMQAAKVADRQNANNVLHVLRRDYEVQKALNRHHLWQRKVRLITTAHDTRNQWWEVWFYVIGKDGNPKWCSQPIKHVNFAIRRENNFVTARRCNLNLCEYFSAEVLPQLLSDLEDAAKVRTGTPEGGLKTPAESQIASQHHEPEADHRPYISPGIEEDADRATTCNSKARQTSAPDPVIPKGSPYD